MGNYQDDQPGQLESGQDETIVQRKSSGECSASHVSTPRVGQAELSRVIEPHDAYEGKHRWDSDAEWTPAEEAAVVRKTDFLLLSWVSLMVSRFWPTNVSVPPTIRVSSNGVAPYQFFGLQLDRGNLSNALTDNLLDDLHMNSNDYNNVCGSSCAFYTREKVTGCFLHRLGTINSTCLLPFRRVSCPNPH